MDRRDVLKTGAVVGASLPLLALKSQKESLPKREVKTMTDEKQVRIKFVDGTTKTVTYTKRETLGHSIKFFGRIQGSTDEALILEVGYAGFCWIKPLA